MALTSDIEVNQVLPGTGFGYPVKAGARIYGRALVGLTVDGFAVPFGASSAAFAGIAESGADNREGKDGAAQVTVQRDCRAVPLNVKPADIGKAVYADSDDITKATTEAVGGRIGVLVGLTSIRQGARAIVNLLG